MPEVSGSIPMGAVTWWGAPIGGPTERPQPNTYEAPSCQETNYPYERIFVFFFALGFLAQSADGLVF